MTRASDAWAERAGELAAWSLARLANRTDAWGCYTAAGGQATARGSLTLARLARHFRAAGRADLLGLHTAGPDNLSLGGALDIDRHGEGGSPDLNLAAALHWHGRMADHGFTPLLTESNGAGGYHLRQLLARPADGAAVFHFLRRLTADYRQLGLASPPEQFPKQPDVRRCAKGLGNWLRLPGRHHRREFWSRAWSGAGWLDGRAAVDFILSLAGDSPAPLPEAPAPDPAPKRPPAEVRPCGRRQPLGQDSQLRRPAAEPRRGPGS